MLDFTTPDDLTIWSFDPGNTTGFAKWENNSLAVMQNIAHTDIFMWLETSSPLLKSSHIVLIEDYKILPGKANAHIFNDLKAANLIGSIEYWAHLRGAQVIKQPSSIKPVGYGRMKKKAPSKANGRDMWDAVAHFVYYLMRNY